MDRVGVENVDISGHYHAPTLRIGRKNVTKIYRRNLSQSYTGSAIDIDTIFDSLKDRRIKGSLIPVDIM